MVAMTQVVIGDVPSWILDGTEVVVDPARNDALNTAIRALPARRWDGAHARWRIPVADVGWDALCDLLERFGATTADGSVAARLQGQPDATLVEPSTAPAPSVAAQATALRSFGRITSVPGMVDPPGKPFAPSQWAGLEHIVIWQSGCLVADEPGVAKTAQSLAALAVLGRRRIIWVCPAVAKAKIAGEVHERFPSWRTTILDGRKAQPLALGDQETGGLELDGTDVVVVNYEILAAHHDTLLAWNPDALVVDEAHRMKEAGTSWTRCILGARARRNRKGVEVDPARVGLAPSVRAAGGSVLLLTGTPMPSGPWELITLLRAMGRLEDLGGYRHFSRHFAGGRDEVVGGKTTTRYSLDRARPHLRELNAALRSHGMLRRRLAEVCPDLVLAPNELVEVPLDAHWMGEYRTAEQDIVDYLGQRAAQIAAELGRNARAAEVRARLRAAMARDGVELTVLRRLAGLAKAPGALGYAREWLELSSAAMEELDGEAGGVPKLVVFAHHADVVDVLANGLGGAAIRGSDSRAVRDAARRAFQEDPEVRVITCSIMAAGEAIELTSASTCLTVEFDWVPKTHIQAVGRLYRRGQTRPVRPLYAYAPGTTDEIVRRVLDVKSSAAAAVIDGAAEADGSLVDVESDVLDVLVRRSAG